MTDALVSLPPHVRRRLEGALDTGMIATSSSATTVRSVLGLRDGRADALLADGEAVFMTSANLTDAAFGPHTGTPSEMGQPETPSPAPVRPRANTRFTFGPRLSSPSGRNRIDAIRIAP